MKKLLFIIFITPLISFSQNNDFLTELFLDSVEIKNQDFKLKIAGVINTKAQKVNTKSDDYYDRNTLYNLTEILFLEDLLVAQQFKSEVFLGNTKDYNNLKKIYCSWNWDGNNPNIKMVSTDSLDYFPIFSFIKGKLLTVTDVNSTSKDYLFSVSKSEEYNNYGHKNLSFNLTDDNEQGYTINTIIIDEQNYIVFSKEEMRSLGFDTKFVDNSQFSLKCDQDYYSERTNCSCICESNYLSFFRKKTKYMEKTYNLDQDDLLYLFKLEEQN